MARTRQQESFVFQILGDKRVRIAQKKKINSEKRAPTKKFENSFRIWIVKFPLQCIGEACWHVPH